MPPPRTVNTPEAILRREKQLAYRNRQPATPFCPDCDSPKSLYATRCRKCAQADRLAHASNEPAAVHRRIVINAWRSRQSTGSTCSVCGKPKSYQSVTCAGCYRRRALTMQRQRCPKCKRFTAHGECKACLSGASAPVIEYNAYCPNPSGGEICETHAPHSHCDCGWPIPPDKTVCRICIAEQKRSEFKTWPQDGEEAA